MKQIKLTEKRDDCIHCANWVTEKQRRDESPLIQIKRSEKNFFSGYHFTTQGVVKKKGKKFKYTVLPLFIKSDHCIFKVNMC